MKKLNLHEVTEKLLELNLKIFRPADLKVMFKVKDRAVRGFLNYNVKKEAFVRLKPGLYALKRNFPEDFFLANTLYSPSYVSLDTALSYYNLIPESVYAVTSITTKPTREFVINKRFFEYRKIKKEAYTGFVPQELSGKIVYLATPEKAVGDFLYFVFLGKRLFNDRLKTEKLNKKELKKYLELFDKKLLNFCRRYMEI